MPILISGYANAADSPAIITSHIINISQPPPKARPFVAAIIGFLFNYCNYRI